MNWMRVALLFAAACAVSGCRMPPKGGSGDVASAGAETATAAARPQAVAYARPGFEVYEEQGRLWVFRDGSPALKDFLASGEPAKRVTLIGAGPSGKTLLGADRESLDAYLEAFGGVEG